MLTHHGITYEMRGDELDDCSGESKYNAFLVVLLKKTTNFDIADFLVDVAVVVPVFVFFFLFFTKCLFIATSSIPSSLLCYGFTL